MTRGRRGPALVATAVLTTVLLEAVAGPVPAALARMTESEVVAATLSTEVLDPPTSLTATATLLFRVNLAWTATSDLRATGYVVLRGTANGGPYTQVATIAGRTTTTYQDTVPLPGQYYYVLRSSFASWTSVNSNQASVLVI